MKHNIAVLNIRGKKIAVEVDGSNGEFSAEYNGQDMSAKTLEQLKIKVERAIASDKIEPVPFLWWDGTKMKRGKCTGIHAGTGHLIVVWDGEKGYEQKYRLEDALPVKLEDEYRQLCDAARYAEILRGEFEKAHRFDMKELLEKAGVK